MFSRIAFTSGSILTKLAKNRLNQQTVYTIRALKTKTLALEGNEIKEVEIETTITPAELPLNPSTQEKIYPTFYDQYDSIPVVVDGQEVIITRPECYPPYPLIPNFAPPTEKAEESEEIHVTSKTETMADIMRVNFADNMPTIDDDKNPQRDLVNYPAFYKNRPINGPQYRLFFFPEWWFEPFYNKTGVTGPYIAFSGIMATLLSKEWLVIDHSVPPGLSFWLICMTGLWYYGPKLKVNVTAGYLATKRGWDDWKVGSLKFLDKYVEHGEKQIAACKHAKLVFDIHRENVHLQREAEYRKRLLAIYNEAKRKLDFQVALDEGKRQFAKRYMINWIIENVNKSITPEKEKSILDQCLIDLKELSNKRANFI